jgi:hypothetical protein
MPGIPDEARAPDRIVVAPLKATVFGLTAGGGDRELDDRRHRDLGPLVASPQMRLEAGELVGGRMPRPPARLTDGAQLAAANEETRRSCLVHVSSANSKLS